MIVNQTKEKIYIKDRIGTVSANQNLQNSLTEDKCATKIIIEVSDSYPLVGTYLEGLIQLIGKKTIVEIICPAGISINGAIFRNMQEVHIKSRDKKHYDDCSGNCARNIRVNVKGINADCPVFFYSKHAYIDGPITISENDLTLITES